MGTDNFNPHCGLPGWHQIVVENRDPGSAGAFAVRKERWADETTHFLQAELLRVSSTRVRELSNARDLEALKAVIGIEAVAKYVIERGLFSDFRLD